MAAFRMSLTKRVKILGLQGFPTSLGVQPQHTQKLLIKLNKRNNTRAQHQSDVMCLLVCASGLPSHS